MYFYLYMLIFFLIIYFSPFFSSFIPVFFFLLLLFITVQGSFYLKQFGLLKTRQRGTEEVIEQRNQAHQHMCSQNILRPDLGMSRNTFLRILGSTSSCRKMKRKENLRTTVVLFVRKCWELHLSYKRRLSKFFSERCKFNQDFFFPSFDLNNCDHIVSIPWPLAQRTLFQMGNLYYDFKHVFKW